MSNFPSFSLIIFLMILLMWFVFLSGIRNKSASLVFEFILEISCKTFVPLFIPNFRASYEHWRFETTIIRITLWLKKKKSLKIRLCKSAISCLDVITRNFSKNISALGLAQSSSRGCFHEADIYKVGPTAAAYSR